MRVGWRQAEGQRQRSADGVQPSELQPLACNREIIARRLLPDERPEIVATFRLFEEPVVET